MTFQKTIVPESFWVLMVGHRDSISHISTPVDTHWTFMPGPCSAYSVKHTTGWSWPSLLSLFCLALLRKLWEPDVLDSVLCGQLVLPLSWRKGTGFVFCHQKKQQLSGAAVLPEREQNFPNLTSVPSLLLRGVNSCQIGKGRIIFARGYRDPGETKIIWKLRIHPSDSETARDKTFSTVLGDIALEISEPLWCLRKSGWKRSSRQRRPVSSHLF